MLRQLVVGVDGSDDSMLASRQAIRIAERTQSAVKYVSIVDSRKTELPIVYSGGSYNVAFERTFIPADPELRGFYDRLKQDLQAFAEKCVERCAEEARERKVESTTVVRSGLPSALLLEECRSGDLLVIGQRGENAHHNRTIVGSTTEDIVHSAPRPVLVCPHTTTDLRRGVLAYDQSPSSENALQFCVGFGPNLWDDFVLLSLGEAEEPSPRVERELRFLTKHDIPARVSCRSGAPVQTILEAATAEEADVIIVGAHAKTSIREYLLGSTTSHLVRRSSRPVLIVY